MSNNVIQFPVENKRFDLSNIAVEPEEIAEKIRLIKMSYFSAVADEIVEESLRAVAHLKLSETPVETNPVESGDIILLKESIISIMCRIVGTEHPLHDIIEDNIIIANESVDEYDEEMFFSYKFKSEIQSVD